MSSISSRVNHWGSVRKWSLTIIISQSRLATAAWCSCYYYYCRSFCCSCCSAVVIKSLIINCVQSPLRVAGRAVYVIGSERLDLTPLPVMSPEVVRCVWNQHRRLRRPRPPSPIVASSRSATSAKASKNNHLKTGNFEEDTEDPAESSVPCRYQIVWNNRCHLQRWNNVPRNTDNCKETRCPPETTVKLPGGRLIYTYYIHVIADE